MENNEVSITRLLNASIERVWDAWTNPESLKQWEAPEGMTTPDAQVNLQVGGEYAVSMQGGHTGEAILTVRGTYKVIEPYRKLSFTWKWDGQEEETIVTVELKAVSKNKTELTLNHRGFTTQDSFEKHQSGWLSTLNKHEGFVQ